MIGLFDMDGSLFDYESHLRKSLQLLSSPDEPEIKSLWDLDRTPYYKARMDLIKSVPGWWRSMPPLEDGFRIYKLAQTMGFDNKILTKGPRSKSVAWMEKLECINDHLGENVEVSIVCSKSETYGNFLYDDFPEYMDNWLKHRPRGLGIMPVNESNKNYFHPNVVKWNGNNFDDVFNALEKCLHRKSGDPFLLGIKMRNLVECLSDPDVKKKDYDTALSEITKKVDEIWRYICKTSERDLDWWAFSNDIPLGRGDGSTGGEFDPSADHEFITIIGENESLDDVFYDYNDGFPTRFLWEDYKTEVNKHYADYKVKFEVWKKEQDEKKKLKKATKQNQINTLRTKLQSILTKEEMKLISFG